jgi:hypothetical protein
MVAKGLQNANQKLFGERVRFTALSSLPLLKHASPTQETNLWVCAFSDRTGKTLLARLQSTSRGWNTRRICSSNLASHSSSGHRTTTPPA